MSFKDFENGNKTWIDLSITNIYRNAICFGLAEGGTLKEFTHTVKDFNPIYHDKTKLWKKSENILLSKIKEIARYYKVKEDDVIAEIIPYEVAERILKKLYDGTLADDIQWGKEGRYLYRTKNVNYVEKSTERICFDIDDISLSYFYASHHITLFELSDYKLMNDTAEFVAQMLELEKYLLDQK